ncbi:hypothetical protein GY45DRAFT_348110 [Cubamyces sp. BRFM 1775]|nr:hypothetical protein GY45DRAFT_348110 [Cubamyces sp. BRFM 1775]
MTRESLSLSSPSLQYSRADALHGQPANQRAKENCAAQKLYQTPGLSGFSKDNFHKSYPESDSLYLHNAALSMNTLPTEILIAIFYDARCRLQDIRLIHVCRLWRQVIFAMPEFWASMLRALPRRPRVLLLRDDQQIDPPSSAYNPLLELCLGLSVPRMIHARLDMSCIRDIERRAFCPHIDRIAEMTVKYETATSIPVFMDIINEGVPNLTTLHYFPMHRQSQWLFPDTFPWPAGIDTLFPNLRELDTTPSVLGKLSSPLMRNLQHLTLTGYLMAHLIDDLLAELNRCSSLVSLTLQQAVPNSWTSTYRHPVEAHPKPSQLSHLRRLSVKDSGLYIQAALQNIMPSPIVHLTLSFVPRVADDLMLVFSGPTILGSHILPSLTRIYVGYVQAKGRVRMLGFTRDGQEQLDVARWYDFAAVLSHIMQPFAHSEVITLAIHLPHLPILLERASWDQDGSVPCPIHLRRLELLGGTPLKLKQRFTRWFLRSCGRDCRPTSDERTLCWVFNVERGREQQSREDLWGLEAVLAEHGNQKLGVLELYGTTLSGQIFTNVARVPTNPTRCAEIVEPHMARLSELVSQVVIV